MNIKYLDDLWRQAVRLKWKNRSFLGGNAEEIHHIIKRRKKNTRWDIDNGCPLTLEQHNKVTNQAGAEAELQKKWGLEKVEILERKSNEYFDKDYDKIKSSLKKEIERYMKGEPCE